MRAINKKLVGLVLGVVLLFAAVGSASAQRVVGYYDRWGRFHPTVVYRVQRPYYYGWHSNGWHSYAWRSWYWRHHRHHYDWDDYWHR
jgi:hypothetical protein